MKPPYAHGTLKKVQWELNILTKGAAIRLEWHDRGSVSPGSSYPNILVLILGDCRPRSENKFTGPLDGRLARMHISEGVVLPFGEVNCDLLRTVMDEDTAATAPGNAEFGRALARVIAHELFHFFVCPLRC